MQRTGEMEWSEGEKKGRGEEEEEEGRRKEEEGEWKKHTTERGRKDSNKEKNVR